MRSVLSSLLLAAALLTAPTVYAAGQATPDEAKAMAIKAAEHLKTVGPDKAFPEFSASGGPWLDRDLYVIVATVDHVVVADGGNANLIGHSTADLKDVDGKLLSKEIDAIRDAGWVEYKWQNPTTKAVEPKAVYWVRVAGYVVGVGAYTN
jgi:cytochrome c